MYRKFQINSSIDDIVNDIRVTKDPIRRVMLNKFLEIKTNQERAKAEDPSLDDLSGYSDSEDTEDENSCTIQEQPLKTKPKSNAEKELESIMKNQKDSLIELDKQAKLKAYVEMIDDNRKDKDQEAIVKTRGKNELLWESKGIYDPRYADYQKQDTMNNNLMERLNSEIDFRMYDPKKMRIEKPFNDNLGDMEEFAEYKHSPEEERQYRPKSRSGQNNNSNPNQRLGQKKPIRR